MRNVLHNAADAEIERPIIRTGKKVGRFCGRLFVFIDLFTLCLNQTRPCAIMASATFLKPAMFAPATRL